MSKYPQPIELPPSVDSTRQKRYQEVTTAAKLGAYVRTGVILFELFGVALTSSSALFMDAVTSMMDIASTLLLIFCIRQAQKPPDEDHPFGHGRYEPFGGLLLGFLLIVTGIVFFIQQSLNLFSNEGSSFVHPYAWIFPVVAMVIMELTYQFVIKTAKKEKSPALAVDGYHYRIDGISSLIASLSLGLAASTPSLGAMIDNLGALAISAFMVGIGVFATKENFFQLVDKIPEKEFFDKVVSSASRVRGVLGTEKIKIQLYGPDAHVNIDVEVEPTLSVEKAHLISQKVRAEIQKDWPAVRDVSVHIEPYYSGDH